jgi:hypothetical protein
VGDSLADNGGTGGDAPHDFPINFAAEIPRFQENAMRAIEVNRLYLRKREKIKLRRMLMMMQVAIGK